MSEPDVYVAYADRTTCAGDNAGCPDVMFLDHTSGKASSAYGANPLQHWSTNPSSSCPRISSVEKPVIVRIGGRAAQLYRQSCQSDSTAAPRYAWLIPGQIFIAITDFGGSGEIVEGSLETATWR